MKLERLRDEYGFTGGYTIVRNYVHKAAIRQKEMFVPLAHLPGHAQVDFGEADGYIGGKLVHFHYFYLNCQWQNKKVPNSAQRAYQLG